MVMGASHRRLSSIWVSWDVAEVSFSNADGVKFGTDIVKLEK